MAIQFVGGRTQTSNTNSPSTFAVSLTLLTGGIATFPSPGDLVLIAYSEGSTTDLALSDKVTTAGFSLVSELYANDTYDMNMAVFSKVMGSTPDYSVNVVGRAGTASSVVINVLVFRGVDQVTPFDVTATTATAIDAAIANPAAITPVTADNVIAIFGANASTTSFRSFTTTSTSYLSGFKQAASAGSTVGNNLGAGYVTGQPAGVSYDPAQWDVGTSPTTSSSGAVTIALRPFTSSNDSLTGSGVTTGNPVIDVTSLTENNTLISGNLLTGSSEVTQAVLEQTYTLVASDITTGIPTLSSSNYSISDNLAGNDITTGVSTVGQTTIVQKHSVVSFGIQTSNPTLDSSDISQTSTLTAVSVTTGKASVQATTISQKVGFTGNNVATGIPTLPTPVLGTKYNFVTDAFYAGAPTIDSSAIELRRNLTAVAIASQKPVVSSTDMEQFNYIGMSSIVTDPASVGTTQMRYFLRFEPENILTGAATVNMPTSTSSIADPYAYNLTRISNVGPEKVRTILVRPM